MFTRTKKEAPPSDLQKLTEEEQTRMASDRHFWDAAVSYMLDEETIGESATRRVIESADLLLEARRARFPL
jgi:hypothetical protein